LRKVASDDWVNCRSSEPTPHHLKNLIANLLRCFSCLRSEAERPYGNGCYVIRIGKLSQGKRGKKWKKKKNSVSGLTGRKEIDGLCVCGKSDDVICTKKAGCGSNRPDTKEAHASRNDE
jgi:hypothetical protein